MIKIRLEGKRHLYINSSSIIQTCDLTTGFLIRALGQGLKVGLVDFSLTNNKTFSFFENLSLSKSFTKTFPRFHIETFFLKKNDKINKCILPLVEYYTIDSKMFWNEIKNFDFLIFYSKSFSELEVIKIKSMLRNKNPETEIILLSNSDKDIKTFENELDFISRIKPKKQNSVFEKKNIVSLTGTSSAKSVIAFGYIIRKCMEKHDVKVIDVEKGDAIFSEKLFFNSFKQWLKMNVIYGTFDYVSTGKPRIDNNFVFRSENSQVDVKEANEALMLIKTSLKKQTPVLAENLSSLIELDLVSEESILSLLNNVTNELVITGTSFPIKVQQLFSSEIELEEIKGNSSESLKKGFDF